MKNYNKIYIDKEKRSERDEYNHLYKKLSAKIYVQLYQIYNPQKDDKVSLQENARDIAQDTIITYLRRIEEGLIIENKEAWCSTVARNKTIDFLRKKKPDRISDYDLSVDDESESKNFNVREKMLIDKSKKEDASYYDLLDGECMEKLKKNHRKSLYFVMRGLKTREIAEALSVPQNTILTWVTNAKSQYAECMGLVRNASN